MEATLTDPSYSTLFDPDEPCLVVIRITPFAPREPYIAVAEASLRMSIFAMSLELMKFIGLRALELPIFGRSPSAVVLPPERGTPSTTIRGSLPALTEELPRIRIEELAPGSPLLFVTITPAALPWINCEALLIAPLLNSSDLMLFTDPVISFFRTVPYPTTTTSLSALVAGTSTTSIVV